MRKYSVPRIPEPPDMLRIQGGQQQSKIRTGVGLLRVGDFYFFSGDGELLTVFILPKGIVQLS